MLQPDTTAHLSQARDYIRSIAAQGLDTSALYISQAYLTVTRSPPRNCKPFSAQFTPSTPSLLRKTSLHW